MSKRRYVPATAEKQILAAISGRTDEALNALERGYEERSWNMCYLKLKLTLQPSDARGSEPRFQKLRRMNFPEK